MIFHVGFMNVVLILKSTDEIAVLNCEYEIDLAVFSIIMSVLTRNKMATVI